MVQEGQQKVEPEAIVRGDDGDLRVFYNRLGLELQTYDQRVASGARMHRTNVSCANINNVTHLHPLVGREALHEGNGPSDEYQE
jgi:hypothetical protein